MRRASIAEILEQCRLESEAERTQELARIGEHVCRPVRVVKFSGVLVRCEVCRKPMRETSVLTGVLDPDS